MVDPSKTPAAYLVGEYKKASGLTLELKMQYKKATARKLTKEYIDALTNRIAEFEQVMDIVGPELDRRCTQHGLSINERGNLNPCNIGEILMTEFIALGEWLLIKQKLTA